MNAQSPEILISQEETAARIARVMNARINLFLNGFYYIGGMPRLNSTQIATLCRTLGVLYSSIGRLYTY